jgi:hypothetical protein
MHIWQMFVDLDGQRQTGWSAQALTWSDIAAFASLQPDRLPRWEIAAIVRIDQAYLRFLDAERAKKDKRGDDRSDVIRARVDDPEAVSKLFAALN